MGRWMIFFLCLCLTLVTMAGPGNKPEPRPIKTDTASPVEIRSFSPERLDEYRKSKDFRYERDALEVMSWWDRLKIWFWSKVSELFHLGFETTWGRVVLIATAVILLIFLVFRMAGADRGWLLEKNSRRALSFQVGEEDVHAIDFEKAIAEAVSQHNYRIAIRLWYLMTLKKLSDTGFIQWKPGKTNYDYIAELKHTPYAAAFTGLTNSFEFFWYGERKLMPSQYEEVKSHFSSFNEQLS